MMSNPHGQENSLLDQGADLSRRDIVQVKKKNWTWADHAVGRTDNRWTTRATEWLPRDGSRRRGRPLTRWRDEINWETRSGHRQRRAGAGGNQLERLLFCSGPE